MADEDAAIVNKVEAVESALHHKNEELAKTCLKDLGDIIKLSFTNKVRDQPSPHDHVFPFLNMLPRVLTCFHP